MQKTIIYLEEEKSKIAIYNHPNYNEPHLRQIPLGLNSNPQDWAKKIKDELINFGKDLISSPLCIILKPNIIKALMIKIPKVKDEREEIELAEKQIFTHLQELDINSVHTYQYKLAPFIYQFICVQKNLLEWVSKAISELKQKVEGVFPLELIIPKLTDDLLSAFELKDEQNYTVIITELTGTIFVKTLTNKPSDKDIHILLKENSLYNIVGREPKIYPLYGDDKSIYSLIEKEGYKIPTDEQNLEIWLSYIVLSKNKGLINSNSNLITLLKPKNKNTNTKSTTGKQNNKNNKDEGGFSKNKIGIIALFLGLGILLQLTLGIDNIFKMFTNKQSAKKPNTNFSSNTQTQITTPQENETQNESPIQPNGQEEKNPPIEKNKIKIRVENGNGVAGSAAKMKFYLENSGYVVSEIGNANKNDYQKTLIFLPEELKHYEKTIVEDLKGKYQTQVELIKEKPENYDVLIIVGQS